MKEIYLVCTRSAITASALTYIINCSPDFYNMSHNNLWLEENSEHFGKAHIINDWWNVADEMRKAYDPDFRNNIVLSEEKLIALVEEWRTFPTTKNICLFTHARNTADIMHYVQKNNLPVKVITTIMGDNSHHFIEAFLRREYNDEMNEFDEQFEIWKYIYYQLSTQDEVWQESYDYCFQMSDWLHKPSSLYTTLNVQNCTDISSWTNQYLRWNNSDEFVEPVGCSVNKKIAKSMEVLTWMYNTNTNNTQTNCEKIKFGILLYEYYQKNYTNDPIELVNDVQKKLGIDLTNNV